MDFCVLLIGLDPINDFGQHTLELQLVYQIKAAGDCQLVRKLGAIENWQFHRLWRNLVALILPTGQTRGNRSYIEGLARGSEVILLINVFIFRSNMLLYCHPYFD